MHTLGGSVNIKIFPVRNSGPKYSDLPLPGEVHTPEVRTSRFSIRICSSELANYIIHVRIFFFNSENLCLLYVFGYLARIICMITSTLA